MNPRSGVNYHAGGLVDRDHVRIFVEHRQRNRFGCGVERRRLGRLHFDGVTGPHRIRGTRCGPAHQNTAGLDPVLDPSAAEFG